ncbi:MAG: protein kinase, partial [Anaerolineales bacterium]
MTENDETLLDLTRDGDALEAAEQDVPIEWGVGDVILDQYEVKELFTGGGMGLVYRVHHRNWNLDLAVKSPRQEFFQSETHKQNFIREAESWVTLGLHPHTVSCHYVRTLGGIPRIFADYVEGGSLSDWIRDRRLYEGGKNKALERILDVAIQFAWGLDYAHERGLVHQDVKPANVMMTPEGIAKVTDFGLAKARKIVGESTLPHGKQSILVSSGGMTPAYCSPEQAAGEMLTRKTDIWSWAVSIMEMFVGEVTWLSGVAASVALEEYLLSDVVDDSLPVMPELIVNLLRCCLQKEQADRPANMMEIAEKLKTVYAKETMKDYIRQTPRRLERRADNLNNRGVSLVDLGKFDDALAAWDLALETDPQHILTIYNQGMLLWRQGQTTDSHLVTQMRQVAQTHSENWLFYYLLSQVHLERDDCQAAIESLTQIKGQDAKRGEVVDALCMAQNRRPYDRRLRYVFRGNKGDVNSVSLSRDGLFALSGSEDKTLKLWDVAAGECIRTFVGHTDEVSSVCLSFNGQKALSGSTDKTLKLWDVATGECIRTFVGHTEEVTSVCLSVDGHQILSGSSDKTLKIWKVATGECIRTFEGHSDWVTSVCLTSDGQRALSGSADMTFKLWEIASGECIRTLKGHTDEVWSICLSEDGHHALSGSADKTLKLWDVQTGQCIYTFYGHSDEVISVCLSADEHHGLSASADKTLRLWDLVKGRCLRTFEGHTDEVWSVSLSDNGYYAIS